MQGRIYSQKANIDPNEVAKFYEKRAEISSLKSVLLNERLPSNAANIRNEKEMSNLRTFLQNKRYDVLDIGSGVGRWASNLREDFIKSYDGIDFSQNFINKANEKFKDDKSVNFYQMSAVNLDFKKLKSSYDLVIMTGVCMYINDEDTPNLFKNIYKLLRENGVFYLQESISVMNERLTLKDFYSDELKCKYSAIYRTKAEYENLLKEAKFSTTGGGNCLQRKRVLEKKPTHFGGSSPNKKGEK